MLPTLHALLNRAADEFPDNVAVLADQDKITYEQLHNKASQLATTLIAHGVRPGDPVGLSLPKSIEAIAAAFGIMIAGACYVPIDPNSPLERAARIAKNVDFNVLVTSSDRLGTLALGLRAHINSLTVFTPDQIPRPAKDDAAAFCWYDNCENVKNLPDIGGEDIAYVLHTSGSTGFPKGVAITHNSALTFVNMAADFFAITAQDRLCSQAPLHFDLSVFDLFVACRQGAAIVLIPEFYSAFPKKMVSAIHDYKITIWNSVVSALTLMMERGQPDSVSLDSVRVVLFSGEAMPVKYARMLRENFANARLFNGYGQTEANTSTYYEIEQIPADRNWRIPIGQAFPDYDVFGIDENGLEIERDGNEGELYVRSSAVANGYWGNLEATAHRFVPDPRSRSNDSIRVFKTGDRARKNSDGNFIFVGRSDDMVKSRGYRIELGEIEQCLLSCPGVEACTCIAIPDAIVGNRLVAFVSPTLNESLLAEHVLAHCRRYLSSYMVPEEILVRIKLPRTSTGKVDRAVLTSELEP